MTDRANPPAPDLLRCRADAPARVRDTLRSAGLDPEPYIAAAGLDAHPTHAAAAARAYGLATVDAPATLLLLGDDRPLDWLAPAALALRDVVHLADLVSALAPALDALVEGQRIAVYRTAEHTRVRFSLPAGLDPRGKDVILSASLAFAIRHLVLQRSARATDLRIVTPRTTHRADLHGVRITRGPAWELIGPPDLLHRSIDLSELAPTAAADLAARDALDALRVALLVHLPDGARLGDVARSLGVSPRTLQARLAARGRTYASVLADVRADVIAALDGLPRRLVAAEVGYRSAEALARFVRQRTGAR